MSKYKKHFQEMLEYNESLFDSFRKIHDAYAADPSMQKEFNTEGEKVLRVIRRYEDELCGRSEGGRYGKYSANLSEKFWSEVRIHFPKIDYIGAAA